MSVPQQVHILQAIQLADQHMSAGRFQEAQSICRQIISVHPRHAKALHMLGFMELHARQAKSAMELLGRSLAIEPNDPFARLHFCQSLVDLHQYDSAILHLRQLIVAQPNLGTAYNYLGIALFETNQFEESLAMFAKSVMLNPQDPKNHSNRARALYKCEKHDQAIQAARKAIQADPNFHEAYLYLGNALQAIGQVPEALAAYRQGLAMKPDWTEIASNLLYSMSFDPKLDSKAMLREHILWSADHAEPLKRSIQPFANDRNPDRRLKIGYLSPYFREHCQALFTVPLIAHHNHEQFEIYCYSDVDKPDLTTRRLQQEADVWRECAGISDASLADAIRKDQIDILVDLTMHMGEARLLLFARKPAPIQIAWLAYPGTTGIGAMDYRLTDPYLDPPGFNDEFYSEISIRLPHTFWCYDPQSDQPAVNDLPADQNGHVTFGCLNNFCKTNEIVFAMWKPILDALPASKLVLLAPQGSARQRTIASLGIDPARIEFVDRQLRGKYLQTYHRIDIGLDTFPYSGHTTSLDALWMGVPVVSRYGKTAVSRAGLSQSSNLGLTELATDDAARFASIAIELAGDLPRLRSLRSSLRQSMRTSPLMNAKLFASGVESAYRSGWHRWCRGQH
ncbi:MAG TPA: tetratricopeptide repeat protein [Tepidisphaeraceae bacterium]|nr:tetratricopeptide repeat protein [Tepidisphaeraceae bacterium]